MRLAAVPQQAWEPAALLLRVWVPLSAQVDSPEPALLLNAEPQRAWEPVALLLRVWVPVSQRVQRLDAEPACFHCSSALSRDALQQQAAPWAWQLGCSQQALSPEPVSHSTLAWH